MQNVTLAMTEGKSIIGWASAIIGAMGFVFGGIVTPLVGIGNIQLSMCIVLITCGALTVMLSNLKISRRGTEVLPE